MHNKAVVCAKQGKQEEAMALHQKSLDMRIKVSIDNDLYYAYMSI